MWVALALACALLTGTTDALSKRLLGRSDERVVAFASLLFTVPWLLIGPLAEGLPHLGLSFWLLIVFMIPLELTATLCFLRAIRISPLSLCVPFLAFSPLLCAVTAWLFLGERITGVGLAGVAFVTVGAYVLQAELVPQGLLEPFRAMTRVPGIRLVLATAAIYGVTSTLGKKAIQLSSPTAFMSIYFTLNALCLMEIARRAAGSMARLREEVRPQLGGYSLLGLIVAASFYTHCFGIRIAPVAYFISIKRLSLLASVLYGGLLYKEKGMGFRLAGAGLMLAGAVLIGLHR